MPKRYGYRWNSKRVIRRYRKEGKNSPKSKTTYLLIFLVAIFGLSTLYFAFNSVINQPSKNSEETENNKKDSIALNKEDNLTLNISRDNLDNPPIKTYISIIIDDLGNQNITSSPTKEILELDKNITLAVLPQRKETTNVASEARKRGFEIILHQPMESVSNEITPGEGAILTGMSEEEIKKVMDKNLSELPNVGGFNNHMGSKVTADSQTVKMMMGIAKEKNLFFIDSLTISNSVAYQEAKKIGLKAGYRDLFLDNKDDEEEIRINLTKLAKMALADPESIPIGIAHPRAKSIKVIQEILPELKRMGVGIKKAHEVVR